ncbi:YidB family protein [Pseudoruegeria sp. SK021]|uniref:YidB family protein n=1 Tax=Pseudoruegeria sp. SK021 TaxID=1933035 RepID=UPI000A23C1AE|nr:YidB family protein [Pseudoruegeria sp. SK021]OSP53974.1 hypothetical protein BV911_15045 [Pseudoruegeria sp. SK021]
MARGGFPSMTALLGLLAVAGFQNWDKISEILANRGGSTGGTPDNITGSSADRRSGQKAGLEGLLGNVFGNAGSDGFLRSGLSELSDRFRQNGHAETVDSWLGTGTNRNVAPRDLEQALGSETLDGLTEHTGLSREELLSRLSRDLPGAVDQYTPEGQLPTQTG